ncbi:Hypothetical predicted protein [Pelobates cultripes]|uniref:Uncharacterized protein n=1 Tax=Pelobates cultripes TaxID=61616 RepID=A0AAD1TH87_PELCU|nr:Hypothetical predicted protein [Pelobates cultripes]
MSGKAEEFPKKTLGQDVPVNLLPLAPVLGSNGQNRFGCESNPETSKQLPTDINENNSNSDKGNKSTSVTQHKGKLKPESDNESITKLKETEEKEDFAKENVIQHIGTDNYVQIPAEAKTELQNMSLQNNVQVHVLKKDLKQDTEPLSVDNVSELVGTKSSTVQSSCSLGNNSPVNLQVCTNINQNNPMTEDNANKVPLQLHSQDNGLPKTDISQLSKEQIHAEECTTETISSTENKSVVQSISKDFGSCDSLSWSHGTHTFPPQECNSPLTTEVSSAPTAKVEMHSLLPHDLESGRRPSSASQYDNMSDLDQCEWPPCPTDASLDKLENEAWQANVCNVLDLSTERTKHADKLPQLSPSLSCQQWPSGSVPTLMITDTDLKEPVNVCTKSSPSIPGCFSPCQVIKTITHVQVSHGMTQNLQNSKQKALPLLDGSQQGVVSLSLIMNTGTSATNMSGPTSQDKKKPISSTPKVQAKYPAIPKANSENNFNTGHQIMPHMSKSVTF